MYQGNKFMIESSSAAAARTMWTREEDELLAKALTEFPRGTEGRWRKIADVIPGKTEEQVIVHFQELLQAMVGIHEGEIKPPMSIQQHNHDERVIKKGESKREGGGDHRKKGIPWSEEEHRRFLEGLETYGKGDWRGISQFAVMTRTPTQVASHAQKYFLRHSSPNNNKRRRASIHDITATTPTPIVPQPLPPVLTHSGSFIHDITATTPTPIVPQPLPPVLTHSGSFHGAASTGGAPTRQGAPIVPQPPPPPVTNCNIHDINITPTPIVAQPPPPVFTHSGSFHGVGSIGGASPQEGTPIVAQQQPPPPVTNYSIHDINITPTPIVVQPRPPVFTHSGSFHGAGSIGGTSPQEGTRIVAQPPPPPVTNCSIHDINITSTPIVAQPPPPVLTHSCSFHGAGNGGAPTQQVTPIVAQPPPPTPVTNCNLFGEEISGEASLEAWCELYEWYEDPQDSWYPLYFGHTYF